MWPMMLRMSLWFVFDEEICWMQVIRRASQVSREQMEQLQV